MLSSAAMSRKPFRRAAMLVLGSVAPISIGTLFIMGCCRRRDPAAVLMILNCAVAPPRRRLDLPRATCRNCCAPPAAVLLVMPGIAVIGIRFGVATPTECQRASRCSTAWSPGASSSTRAVDLRHFCTRSRWNPACWRAWCCSSSRLPSLCTDADRGQFANRSAAILHSIGDNRIVFTLGSIMLLIVVGSACWRIAGADHPWAARRCDRQPIRHRYPSTRHDPLILAMGVGIFIPPIGIGFYVSCAVSEEFDWRPQASDAALSRGADRRHVLVSSVRPARSPCRICCGDGEGA